ncbi:MAG: tRNA guanosine(34) transglycosylase Tgt [Elusimicrobiota bacterium]|nr:tRNA guanosine(34) transglycosylase Tgt [Elusimicrobiota bacterium]
MSEKFKITSKSSRNRARTGEFSTEHGTFTTPAFMTVGTRGTVKAMTPRMIKETGAEIILANNFHLTLKPGVDIIAAAGGLHNFMGWPGPILTDSGGYQVFSLSDIAKVEDRGVWFRSPYDGSKNYFTPAKVVKTQSIIGSDIMMALDECIAYPHSRAQAEKAMLRTGRWAKMCREEFERLGGKSISTGKKQSIFAVVQGGSFEDLRDESVRTLTPLDFDGYAIGGVSVGEPGESVKKIINYTAPLLPEEKPRYVMGLGDPAALLSAVAAGVDMFDCVMPTRHGRNGWLYTSKGRIVIRNAQYKKDFTKPDPSCGCYTCSNFSRAYLNHLFRNNEILASMLNSLHNIYFMVNLIFKVQKSIKEDNFNKVAEEIQEFYE